MRNFLIKISCLWILTLSLDAQVVPPYQYYNLGWDNDVLHKTDLYYTQGMNLQIVSPHLKYNPINKLLITSKNKSRIYGFAIEQQIYTPKNIVSPQIQINDRPYAGVLKFTSSATTITSNNIYMVRSELDLGVMGPASGGGDVQYEFHKKVDSTIPQGWEYQQYNWPIINYNINLSKELISARYFETLANSQVRLGTLHSDATVSLLIRAGKTPSYRESFGIPINNKSWQLYATLKPSLTFVGYNATMQGGWHQNPKIHYLEYQDLKSVVGRVSAGFGVSYKNFGLRFSSIFTTPEFNNGKSHQYTNTLLFLTF